MKHSFFFFWKKCLLASIVLMTSHASPKCFPSQKIQTGLPFLHYIIASLFRVAHLHCLRVHHLLCVFSSTAESKFVYQDIQISVLTIFIGSHNIGPHLWYFVDSGRHEPPKHVGFAHRQQCIIISARALDKFLNLQVIGSFDDREVQYFF